MNTLIVSGGKINITFLNKLINSNSYDIIVAVDKGLEALYAINIIPQHIVGDFDSVNRNVIDFYSNKSTIIHKYNSEKDYTDTDIALKLSIELGSTNISIIGATGTRIDHILANIHILIQALNNNINCSILDENNKIYLINSSTQIEKSLAYGNYISLIPFTTNVTGVTLKGFKYPLENYTLEIGKSLGVSNEIVDNLAKIELDEGILIVIESKD